MLLRTWDLSSTLDLVESLISFKNHAFHSSHNFSKIPVEDLVFWMAICGPFGKICPVLDQLSCYLMEPDFKRDLLISQLLYPLKSSNVRDYNWIREVNNICLDMLCGILSSVKIKIAENSAKSPLTLGSTQDVFMILRNVGFIVEAYNSIKWRYFGVGEAGMDHLIIELQNLLSDLSEITLSRVREMCQREKVLSLEALKMIEQDIESSRMLGCLIPALDSFALIRYDPVFTYCLQYCIDYLKVKSPEIQQLSNDQKITAIDQIINRRCKILYLFERNMRYLNTRNVLIMENPEAEIKSLLAHLHINGYSLLNCCSRPNHVLLASPLLAKDDNLLQAFFKIHMKRSDLFSDDFIIAISNDDFSKYNKYHWNEFSCECPSDFHDADLPNGRIMIYSHCFTTVKAFVGKLDDLKIASKCTPLARGISKCFIQEHYDLFLKFMQDSFRVVMLLPVAQFDVKALDKIWVSAVSFWDLAESFFTGFASKILWTDQEAKAELCISAIILLKVACMNIRLNYLEPFTWAADILYRFTNFMSKCERSFVNSFMAPAELAEMYREFQQKWLQIEHSANKQWEQCVVFKKEITSLQIAACNLERALWIGSKFLRDVKPIDHMPENFLLNFLSPIRPPIFDFVDSKGLKIVSILKRKQWIETYCCYDLQKRIFVAVKEIKLVRNAVNIAQDMKIAERYKELGKFNHPNLGIYHDAELRGDTLFIAMEFCTKRSLSTLISENGEITDELVFKDFCRNILLGLSFLHSRGMAHGDLQPGNVLQDKYGYFKFVDYGDINRQFKAALSKVDLSYMSNTVPYMAPEVVIHSKEYDPIPADVWSFGCLITELITGFRPWHELEHDYAIVYRLGATKFLPEALLDLPISQAGSEFVKSCLTHDPRERPTVTDLLRSEYLSVDVPYRLSFRSA